MVFAPWLAARGLTSSAIIRKDLILTRREKCRLPAPFSRGVIDAMPIAEKSWLFPLVGLVIVALACTSGKGGTPVTTMETPTPEGATYKEEDFRVVFPITLDEILNGQEPCPPIPEGYRPSQSAVGEAGYHYGGIFIDARVDVSSCDAYSAPRVRNAKEEVLRWWVRSCDGIYTLVGRVVRFQRPGDVLREILITKEMADRGCAGLGQARAAIAIRSGPTLPHVLRPRS